MAAEARISAIFHGGCTFLIFLLGFVVFFCFFLLSLECFMGDAYGMGLLRWVAAPWAWALGKAGPKVMRGCS